MQQLRMTRVGTLKGDGSLSKIFYLKKVLYFQITEKSFIQIEICTPNKESPYQKRRLCFKLHFYQNKQDQFLCASTFA